LFSCNWQVTWAIKSWQSSGRMHNCSLWFFSCVINHLPYPLFSSSCIFTVCMMLSWCNPFVHLNLLNHKYLFLRCSFRSRSIARVIHLVTTGYCCVILVVKVGQSRPQHTKLVSPGHNIPRPVFCVPDSCEFSFPPNNTESSWME